MAILDIKLFPDAVLREKAKPVEKFDAELRRLLDDMADTMYEAPGVGLAAPQIGRSIRVIVVDVGEGEDGSPARLYKLINPEIIDRSEGTEQSEEGCLSIPGIREYVSRPSTVTVSALDEHQKPIEIKASGLLSVCLQHEIDHLDGILFIDYLSGVKRELVRAKLKKLKKKS